MRKILEKIPYSMLVPAALLLGLAPFVPQPHLFEKIGMLFVGELRRLVDIFDLVMHASPAVVLAVKWLIEQRGS
ncbi:MAG: RND transporter [Desulfuromonas sp.]|nr:MAG: RND transporter [Desulfuromonas sp.]